MPHSPTSTLLLEIGVEELPASFVDGALAALPDLTRTALATARLAHGEVRALGTPRRLAILVSDVSTEQTDVDEEVVGPPEGAAYKDGAPTKAAEAFATKLGVPLSALSVAEKPASGRQKAGRYLVGRRSWKGGPATEVLGAVLRGLVLGIPFRKSMRWGAGSDTFGRPVQWLVALFGTHAIDLSFGGVRSGRVSRGHRFLSPDAFEVASADDYESALRERHVIVDRAVREDVMMAKVKAAAEAVGGTYDTAKILVEENTSLVEEPHVITGSFDREFLDLPAAVIRAVARGHQRYFCVEKGEGELLPHYINVANTALDVPTITRGNDSVMRARLSDAKFFFEEDKKADIEARVEKLSGIVFHQKLGTVRDKVKRMERLARTIATELDLAGKVRGQIERAAHLSKFDLVALMVGEFPELEGEMGRAYAKHNGEPDLVADAIRDHYKPAFATDDVPRSDVSAAVSLADRLDTLAGCFGIGLEPSGTADPYALRRACIAVLRTLLELGTGDARYAKLDLLELLDEARDGYSLPLEKDAQKTLEALSVFATERLRGLIGAATSNQVADAVLVPTSPLAQGALIRHPVYALARARALHAVVIAEEPWLSHAKTVAKRLSGISKQSPPVLHPASAFDKPDDLVIVEVVEDTHRVTHELYDEESVRRALKAAGALAERVDTMFAKTLMNDPLDEKTPKRLELLSFGAACMLRLADFTKLGGS